MNRTEYRKLHSAARAFVRFATEAHDLGASAADTPNHPALRGLLRFHHANRDLLSQSVPTLSHRPASYRYPLHRIPADLRRQMLRDARLRRCGVHDRVAPLPLP